jgi:hypothetical protein
MPFHNILLYAYIGPVYAIALPGGSYTTLMTEHNAPLILPRQHASRIPTAGHGTCLGSGGDLC